ncbi:MAG: M60 family metallopeptidase, partial [Lachnospiraceae bacterium]|nr:M60 family metallopeptidase [Lachnospiraceae bacterium]
EIMSLYQDDLHMVLRPEVTQSTINTLRFKINQIDEVSGEYNPDREVLERELKTAEDILNDVALNAPIEIHSDITTNDVGRGFGGINAWQPLGITAGAGDKITIYVGHSTKKTGDATNLSVVASQYHSESNAIASGAGNLKVGANVIVIPRIGTLAEQENGGAIYIQYSGNKEKDPGQYAVRVSGGVSVPKLDLYQVTDQSERLALVTAYIRELEAFVGKMEENHNKFHTASENNMLNSYAYDKTNCILGASDILLDTMMLSLPADQLLAGAGSGTLQEKAAKMLGSLDAMGDMMYLFYQHKGLNAGAADAVDQIPKGHLNIRYQRMFAGAFMYAAGNHIGIEYGSAAGLTSCAPVVADADGRWQSGHYFGWGIAHEIGHDINQGAYAVAEITNNYFAVLAQAHDNNTSVRFSYDNVFKKVTSNTLGKASNVFTQLAMYWQLHLAYDKGYNYKTYADYNEQLSNLFFARVDTYARTPAKAPAPGNVTLTISGGTDQALMRLSCAAAEKNLLEFFERWGMVPDEGTIAYASQFEEETRAIYYANDDARVYALTGTGTKMGEPGTFAAVGDGTQSVINTDTQNQVDFTLVAQGIPAEDILGFEITRCMISGGDTQKQVVGFTTGNTFTDTISSINNRMVWYEVVVIDKYLNRSAAKVLEPLKIEHDGSLDKSFFTVSTTGLTVEGETEDISGSTSGDAILDTEQGTGDKEAAPKSKDYLIDHDTNTVYTANAGANAEIVLKFNETVEVTGFKYTAPAGQSPVGNYVISLLCGDAWKDVATGTFGADEVQTVFFANGENKYVATYEATALKLKLEGVGSTISIAELDVLGVTGDNVEFRSTVDGTPAIGTLAADYPYAPDNADGTKNVIPAGSIIFTGSYKGNPAYNTVILYDQAGNPVVVKDAAGDGKSYQVILADVPKEGDIANTSDGTWIYWIEPTEGFDVKTLKKVRVELYRVNDALTNEGQRLVSDSLFEVVPETLPPITIDGGSTTGEVAKDPTDTPSEDENTPSDTPSEDVKDPTDTPSGDENTPSDTPSEDVKDPSDTPSGDENTPSDTPSEDVKDPSGEGSTYASTTEATA